MHTQTNTVGFSPLWEAGRELGGGGGGRGKGGGNKVLPVMGLRSTSKRALSAAGGIKHLPGARLLRVDAKTLTILDFCCQCAANKCN